MTADDTLTIETLNAARQALAASTGSACAVVGIACSPQVEARLKRGQPDSFTGFGAVPLLIDPRMSSAYGEVYSDRELWRSRCKEQAEWDSQTSTPNAPISCQPQPEQI